MKRCVCTAHAGGPREVHALKNKGMAFPLWLSEKAQSVIQGNRFPPRPVMPVAKGMNHGRGLVGRRANKTSPIRNTPIAGSQGQEWVRLLKPEDRGGEIKQG